MTRRGYLINIYREIYQAFKLLCDRSGYKRLNEAVEGLMLKCIRNGSLGLPQICSRMERLEMRIKLIEERDMIKKALGWRSVEKRVS